MSICRKGIVLVIEIACTEINIQYYTVYYYTVPPNLIEDVEGEDVVVDVQDVTSTAFTVSLVKEFFEQNQHGVIIASGLIGCSKAKCNVDGIKTI